jgi:hypothetical protein
MALPARDSGGQAATTSPHNSKVCGGGLMQNNLSTAAISLDRAGAERNTSPAGIGQTRTSNKTAKLVAKARPPSLDKGCLVWYNRQAG